MKVQKFDKDKVNAVRNDMRKAMNEVAEKYGLTINQSKKITYYEDNFSITFKAATPSAKERAVEDANYNGQLLGLGKDIVGQTFNCLTPTSRNRLYEITDINMCRPKYPVCAISLKDGKKFKFDVETVKTLMKDK